MAQIKRRWQVLHRYAVKSDSGRWEAAVAAIQVASRRIGWGVCLARDTGEAAYWLDRAGIPVPAELLKAFGLEWLAE